VTFAAVSDEEIDAYVATGEPLGVAGGFTIDGRAGPFITSVDGDPHAVVGLSLPLLRDLLTEIGIGVHDLWETSASPGSAPASAWAAPVLASPSAAPRKEPPAQAPPPLQVTPAVHGAHRQSWRDRGAGGSCVPGCRPALRGGLRRSGPGRAAHPHRRRCLLLGRQHCRQLLSGGRQDPGHRPSR